MKNNLCIGYTLFALNIVSCPSSPMVLHGESMLSGLLPILFCMVVWICILILVPFGDVEGSGRHEVVKPLHACHLRKQMNYRKWEGYDVYNITLHCWWCSLEFGSIISSNCYKFYYLEIRIYFTKKYYGGSCLRKSFLLFVFMAPHDI